MGKRKRSEKSDYDHLLKKMKKLEEKIKKRRSRTISSSSSSMDDGHLDVNVDDGHLDVNMDGDNLPTGVADGFNDTSVVLSPIHSDINGNEPDLNPEILELLGSDPSIQNNYGENLHKDVMSRWKYILINGLEKDTKTELLKAYPPPENCPNLKAPKLNAEIKAALNEINNKKESFNENKQNQLASCLAALGKALNTAFDGKNQEIIKPLSDAGRLLCDYHFRESQSRRYAIINTLNKDIRETVRNTKIDDFLFGADLAEHLKSAKAINKSSSELRIPPKPPQKVPPQRGALNSRGTRGVASATRHYPRRPAATTTTRDRDRDHQRQPSSSTRSSSHRGKTRKY